MKRINSKPLPKKERFEGITIGSEWTNEERPSYICDNCHCSLVRLSDRNNQNESWYCNRCSIEYPDTTRIRKESKLSVPQETEPAVSIVYIDLTKDVEIQHPKELRGGIAELQKRGLKITYFDDSSQR